MSQFACTECGYTAAKWFGRCAQCSAWSTAVDARIQSSSAAEVVTLSGAGEAPDRIPIGIEEVDRVLGGGLVIGEVCLLAGEPGIGKSTLTLQVLQRLIAGGRSCLLVSGEESVSQIALRAMRLGVNAGAVRVVTSQALDKVVAAIERERPDVVVVDSIHTLESSEVEQVAGSVMQVRACAAELVRLGKRSGSIIVLVGHVTKEGTVAGPKALEHMVDAVLTLEGDRHGGLRLLRSSKNRFGSCEEIGVFVMNGAGLEPVPDPSALLLADRRPGVTGSVVFPSLEGSRPVLVELQSLVSAAPGGPPRRVALGIEARRLAMLLGVLSERADLVVARHDVFVSTAAGISVREPAADLALCMSVYSAASDQPVAGRAVAIGEVGLGGEVRRVSGTERRLTEAARLGFDTAFVPRGTRSEAGLRLIEARDLEEAFRNARATVAVA